MEVLSVGVDFYRICGPLDASRGAGDVSEASLTSPSGTKLDVCGLKTCSIDLSRSLDESCILKISESASRSLFAVDAVQKRSRE